jgi:transposase
MRPFFMSYVRGEDRGQGVLLPSALEDYVTADGPVRVIDAFVDGLDVSGLGFGRAAPAGTGRPPYDPRDLLKLYVYGYLNEVRSSRRLERECGRNVEVMSLLRRLAPDFKTIADFRRDNGAAIVGACRAFVLFCRDQGLFRARLVALDGSKFRAAASPKRIMGRREIVEEAARLDRRIADYLAGLDESDAREPDEAPNATAGALEALKTRRIELDRMAAALEAEERNTLVEGEPDARPMGFGKGPKPPSYNVQTAVDADTGLIVHHAVTSEPNDTRQLHPMAKAAKEALGFERLTVVADAGYSNGAAAAACEADGITACTPANRGTNSQGEGALFDRSASPICPQPTSMSALRAAPLLRLLVEATLHDGKTPLRHPSPARGGARTDERPRQGRPEPDPTAPMRRRTSVRNDQAHDRRRPISHPRPQKGRRRSGAQRYGLQHHPRHQPPRRSKPAGKPRLKNKAHSAQQKRPRKPGASDFPHGLLRAAFFVRKTQKNPADRPSLVPVLCVDLSRDSA